MSDSLDFVVNVDDKKVELFVRKPTVQEKLEGDEIYNREFTAALSSKPPKLFKKKMLEVIKEQGLWSDEKQNRLEELQTKINEIEKKTSGGGMYLKDAAKLWIDTRKLRNEQRDLMSIISEYDSNTVEGIADNARFNYLVSCCIMSKETGQRYYQDIDDFLKNDRDSIALMGVLKFAQVYYDYGIESDEALFENKALKKYNLVDDELRLINKDGHLVDGEGRLINKDGFYIDADGNRVDIEGNPLDEEGYIVNEFKPFLDDEGKPISDSSKDDKPSTTKKTQRKKNTEKVSG